MKTFLETTKGAASATGGRSYGVGRVV